MSNNPLAKKPLKTTNKSQNDPPDSPTKKPMPPSNNLMQIRSNTNKNPILINNLNDNVPSDEMYTKLSENMAQIYSNINLSGNKYLFLQQSERVEINYNQTSV